MTVNGWLQIALFCAIVIADREAARALHGPRLQRRAHLLSPVLAPGRARRSTGCAASTQRREQGWVVYAVAMLLFSLAGFLTLYALMRLQALLPFNPPASRRVEQDLAFNTAISFATNTNWQSYVPRDDDELPHPDGGAHRPQLRLGRDRHRARRRAGARLRAPLGAAAIGNFWVDLTRATLYVLLPISFVVALVLVWQGVPQNLDAYTEATTLEGAKQTIAQGPVACRKSIKKLGTNGGGFFNANSAHPFENPTRSTNLIEMVLIFAIGAALTYMFGRMVGDERQGWALFGVMGILFLAGVVVAYWAEAARQPGARRQLGTSPAAATWRARRSASASPTRRCSRPSPPTPRAARSTPCTTASRRSAGWCRCSTSSSARSSSAASAAGLYGMLVFAIIAVFIAGLMVGRTPEYLGKKIEAKEVKMAMLAVLILPLSILGFTAIATVVDAGLAGPANQGPHGFSEILYAFTSGTGNNGSAFAGLSANTLFYNTTLGLAMLIGRFLMIVPMLAIAGSLAAKKIVPASAGTFPTDGGLFVGLLVGVILIVGALTYFPALALGPIVEQLSMNAGTLF